MEDRSIAIIGSIVLFLALLSPLVIENRGKIDRLFSEAESSYNDKDYINAIEKYSAAKKESKKVFTKTDHIHKDFRTHINIKIALCYFDLGNSTQDQIYYTKSLIIIDKNLKKAKDHEHICELQFINAMIYYKIGKFNVAFSNLIEIEENHVNFEWYHEIIYTIGDIYYQQEKYKEALAYFQKLIRTYPSSEFSNQAKNLIDEINVLVEDNNKSEKSEPKPQPVPPKPIPTWEKESKRILDKATALSEQTKTDEAMELYKMLIEQYPDSQFVTLAYEGIGDIYSSANNVLEARANYEEAIYSTGDEIRRNILYQKYHNAFPLPHIVRPDPIDPIVQILLEAIRLRESGKYFEAANEFVKLVGLEKIKAEKAEFYKKAASCYYEAFRNDNQKFNKSEDALQKLIANYSESQFSIQAYYYLALVYRDYALANNQDKTHFQSVIDIVDSAKKKYSPSENRLTQTFLLHLKNLKELALRNMNPSPDPIPIPTPSIDARPLKVDPIIQLIDLAYRHFEKNDLSLALQNVRKALEINPNYQRAIVLLNEIRNKYFKDGLDYLNKSKYQIAIVEFKNALRIDKGFEKAYCNIGVAYIYMERYNDAINELKFALLINAGVKEVYFNLALAYYELKKYNEANREIKKALEIDPKYANAIILMDSIDRELK